MRAHCPHCAACCEKPSCPEMVSRIARGVLHSFLRALKADAAPLPEGVESAQWTVAPSGRPVLEVRLGGTLHMTSVRGTFTV